MDCLINKIPATVSDNTLPVLTGEVIRKTYIKTTVNGQYIDLSSIFANIKYQDMKVDATVQHLSVGSNATLMQTTSGYAFIYCQTSSRISSKIGDANVDLETVTAETDVNVGFDGPNKTAWVGATTNTTANAISGSKPTNVYLFMNINGNNSIAGAVKVKEFKVYNAGVLVADLVPATYDGVACLYDTVNEVPYYEKNGGTLAVS